MIQDISLSYNTYTYICFHNVNIRHNFRTVGDSDFIFGIRVGANSLLNSV